MLILSIYRLFCQILDNLTTHREARQRIIPKIQEYFLPIAGRHSSHDKQLNAFVLI
jgi:hypothetical protein